ncbi:MAG: hypothetical protein K6G60_09510 [Lachnospiraceae bacterium]|nr:hypothetical protein [Lachnospiraceae bacterium]
MNSCKYQSLGEMVLERLEKDHKVERNDIGTDALLKKSGFKFTTETYEIENIGHLCILRMSGMLGLMHMETVVLSTVYKDSPLINLDRVMVMGKETMLAELYDNMLTPLPKAYTEKLDTLKEKDGDLAEYVSGGEHWYDPILLPCSYRKTGKKVAARFEEAAKNYFDAYVSQTDELSLCDKNAKTAKVRDFAEKLISNGGPAVNQVKKLFGDEVARRLILKHMYGVE